MVACCPRCGQDIATQVIRGSLGVATSPLVAFWKGSILQLQPAHNRILLALARTGKASTASMVMTVLGEHADPEALKVHISNLRRRLPPELRIEAIRGWGYQLVETAA